jgi:uncharacterized protein DUF4259
MGAWGTDVSENHTACDFAAEVVEGGGLKKIEAALDRVLSVGNQYLEALAPAEIVARFGGKFGKRDAYTESVDKWVTVAKLSSSASLVEKARGAVRRIQTEPSELLELWSEGEDSGEWKASLEALLKRL